MQKNLSIGFENFRVFNEMTEFEFAPITILTGANSSGKSTIIKGLVMMEQFFKPRVTDIGRWEIPLLDFSKQLKVLGSFSNIISNPENDCIIVKLSNQHIYFGNYQLVLKFGKNGNTTGRLTHFSIIMENIDEPIVEFKYDVSADEDIEYRWYCKADHFWLLNCAKFLISEVKKSNNLTQIYKTYTKQFENLVGEDNCNWEMNGFTPEISQQFFDFLTEKDFDFVTYKLLQEKMFFLLRLKVQENLDYYKYYSEAKIHELADGILLEDWVITVISSLDESYSAYDFYQKLIEIFPALKNEKDLLEDCEVAFSDGSLSLNDFKKIQDLVLQMTSEIYIKANAHGIIWNEVEIPYIKNEVISLLRLEYPDKLNLVITKLGSRNLRLYQQLDIFCMKYRMKFFVDYGIRCQAGFDLRNLEEFSGVLFFELLNETSKHFSHIAYIEANRVEAKRSFNFQSDTSSFNQFVRSFCEGDFSYQFSQVKFDDKKKLINNWLKKFEIADEMEIEINEDGDGAKIFLVKAETKRNIADLGYGTTQLLPMLMYVAHFAVNNGAAPDRGGITMDGVHHWSTVGSVGDPSDIDDIYPYTICIEEPETNLHPMMQAKLADFFVFCNKELKINFIIETHSEALIRKLQYLTAKGDISPQESIIYYIGNPDSSKRAVDEEQVCRIEIKRNGQLSKPFGSGFTDEATKWIKEMFTYSSSN